MKIKTQQFQNLWDTAKAVLKGMFTDIKTYLRKQEKSQINNLSLHQTELEKEQTKLKVSRKKKKVMIITEIHED